MTRTPAGTSTSIFPPGVTCIDWRDGAVHGWQRSTWTPAGVVHWDTSGMYAINPTNRNAGAYFQFPSAGTYNVTFATNSKNSYQLAQGPAPGTSPLSNPLTLTPGGYYTVNQRIIELQWQTSTTLTQATVFWVFCYTPVPSTTPTATLTSTVRPTFTPTGTPTTGSDLVINQIDSSGFHVDGQTLAASGGLFAQVANIGQTATGGPSTLTFFDDVNNNQTFEPGVDTVLGTVTVPNLALGQTVSLSAPVPTGTTVQFFGSIIHAFVDSANVIKETNENNNYSQTGQICTAPVSRGTFQAVLKWQWTDSTLYPSYNQVIQPPVVADINKDGIPDIVFVAFGGGMGDGVLRAITHKNGITSDLFAVLNDPTGKPYNFNPGYAITVADLYNDGHIEIIATTTMGEAIVLNSDGTLNWRSPPGMGIDFQVADLLHNGHPELFGVNIGGVDSNGRQQLTLNVLDNHGALLWSYASIYLGDYPIAVDLDLTGTMDIVSGGVALHADGSLYWLYTDILPPGQPFRGLSGSNAIGNFDSDPYPEVVVMLRGRLSLLTHDGHSKWLNPVYLPDIGRPAQGGYIGGPPVVADMDGDGIPEIGIAGSYQYTVFNADGTVKWTQKTDDHSSATTGSSVFDFFGDGTKEVVYGDEHYLYIYRGSDGAILQQILSSSATLQELPVIVDADGNGQAEIVKVSNSDNHGIQVYGALNNDWVPTRKIWNEFAYHITNVNDDGTIPRYEAYNWQTFNNFRLNAFASGCATLKPDLTASYVRKTVIANGTQVTARIGNGGGVAVRAGVSNTFYDGDPRSGGTVLGTVLTTKVLQPGQFEDINFTVPVGVIARPLWVVADDTGGLHGQIDELNEDNNLYNSHIYLTLTPNQPPTVSAGPNQTITLPAIANLNGTASDDGLPINTLTYIWTTVSAPGVVTFGTANSLQTTASFALGGIYVLRLSVSDGDLTSTSDVTITAISTITPTPTATGTPQPPGPLDTPPWIYVDAPDTTKLTGIVPVRLIKTETLQSGVLDFWPVDDTSLIRPLPITAIFNVPGGSKLADFDTTQLANGSYIIRLVGKDTNAVNNTKTTGVLVTIVGDYKPGRVRFSVTDMTIPVVGLPITIGRTYDSLERNRVSDFGYGWSLDLGSPRLTIDPANNVTLTQPNGQRVTFYFRLNAVSLILGVPSYSPEPGVYGKLDPIGGCSVFTFSGGGAYCYDGTSSGSALQPKGYKYTDPFGRVFIYNINVDPTTQKQTSSLVSITDLKGNVLKFTPNGIFSSAGCTNGIDNGSGCLNVIFTRDVANSNRITQIIDPDGRIYQYGYDGAGNLNSVTFPTVPSGVPITLYHYYDATACATCVHMFKDAVDPRGNTAAVTTYFTSGINTGRLQTVNDAVGNQFQYSYDIPNTTTFTINPDGGKVTDKFDSYGSLTDEYTCSVTADPCIASNPSLVHKSNSTYDPNHKLITQTDGDGVVTTYGYDPKSGQRSSVVQTINGQSVTVLSTSYNDNGAPASLTNALGTVWSVGYDETFSLPNSVTDTLGTVGTYLWDSHGDPLTQSIGTDKASSSTYNAQYGYKDSETDPRGYKKYYTYDTFGRVRTIKDARNNTTETIYDALGNVLYMIDPLGHKTSYEYDLNGNKVAMIDANQRRTTYTYDAANRLTQVTYPNGTTTRSTYDFRGNQLLATDQANHVTSELYDAAGQLIQMTLATGTSEAVTTKYTYSVAGRKKTQIDGISTNTPVGHSTSYTYFADSGLLSQVSDPMARLTSYQYNAAGQTVRITDNNNHVTRYVYDIRGRQCLTVFVGDTADPGPGLPCGTASTATIGTVRQVYDGAGRVIDRYDQNGKNTHYAFFDGGLLQAVTAARYTPDETTTLYTYDPIGNLSTIMDGSGHTTSFQYDPLNRQSQKVWADNNTYETFAYDWVGNLTRHQMVSPARSAAMLETVEYDSLNRPTLDVFSDASSYMAGHKPQAYTATYTLNGLRQTVKVDEQAQSYTTTYTYDTLDRVLSVAADNGQSAVSYTWYPMGTRQSMTTPTDTVIYQYNAADELTDVSTNSQGKLAHYDYDPVGLRKTKTLFSTAGGATPIMTVDYGYDSINHLKSITDHQGAQTPIASYTYSVDLTGNRNKVIEQDGTTSEWTYDNLYRLTCETHTTGLCATTSLPGTTRYAYDHTGNRTTLKQGSQLTSYQYNALDELTTSTASGVTTNYTYDARGNLINTFDGTNSTTYTFDLRDRLVGANVPGGTNVGFAYDADGRRTQQSINGAPTNYLWDTQSPYGDVIQETDGAGNRLASYVLGGAELLTQTRGTTTNFYLHDGQGSVHTLTNAAGAITDSYVYDAYGNGKHTQGMTVNPYQYTGQQFDVQTGLYDLRARYYVQGLGRFINRDSFVGNEIGSEQTNRYGYAESNPTNFQDPSGLCPTCETSSLNTIDWFIFTGVKTASKLFVMGGALAVALLPLIVWFYATWVFPNGKPDPSGLTGSDAFKQLATSGRLTSAQREQVIKDQAVIEPLINDWNKGTFIDAAESIAYHFVMHAQEVDTNTVAQYMTKASRFLAQINNGEIKNKSPADDGNAFQFETAKNRSGEYTYMRTTPNKPYQILSYGKDAK